jgi:hypothetical protein
LLLIIRIRSISVSDYQSHNVTVIVIAFVLGNFQEYVRIALQQGNSPPSLELGRPMLVQKGKLGLSHFAFFTKREPFALLFCINSAVIVF